MEVGHHADHMPRILRELRAHSFANQDLVRQFNKNFVQLAALPGVGGKP